LVGGLPVFGTERELRGILHQRGAQALLVATDAIPLERLQRAADTCRQAGARMFRLNVRVEQFGETLPLEPPPLPEGPSSAAAIAMPIAVSDTIQALGASPCPSCGSHQMRRSKARSFHERLRKGYTQKRMFRCQQCSWRGWLIPLECATAAEATWSPDLTAIDTSMGIDQLHSAM
jgi:hypothetical protein